MGDRQPHINVFAVPPVGLRPNLIGTPAALVPDPMTKFYASVRRQTHVALDHAVCTSIAQRTASTTLWNSMRLPSPVRLTMRP
jgi:hypothetical protein